MKRGKKEEREKDRKGRKKEWRKGIKEREKGICSSKNENTSDEYLKSGSLENTHDYFLFRSHIL